MSEAPEGVARSVEPCSLHQREREDGHPLDQAEQPNEEECHRRFLVAAQTQQRGKGCVGEERGGAGGGAGTHANEHTYVAIRCEQSVRLTA